MLSLSERLEQINKLRKKAMNDPAFIHSARAHEKAILSQNQNYPATSGKTKHKTGPKSLAEIYAIPEQGNSGYNTPH